MARIRNQKTNIATNVVKSDNRLFWHVAIYIRLSREDGNEESESVINQKKIISEYLDAFFKGQYEVIDFYIDDGLTGTDDTRAEFMRMIQDIEQNKVNCMICKTLARAFRNYSDQGYYLEYYFPQKNVRFISIGDPQIDTYTNPDAITGLEVPITGLMNDRFAGRTSSDVRRTFNTKRRNGEYIGAFPPYGYLKHPENKNKLILDEEILPIKKDIYSWIVNDGMSLNGAAHKLNALGILNPSAYKRSKGWNYHNPHTRNCDGLWTGCTVKRILLDPVNLGHMVQGKQRVVSYKVHDRISVPKDEWFVKKDTHEPTFTQEEYDTLERLLSRDTRTANGKREVYLFSGFLRCNDCKKALQRKSAKAICYYACRTYTEKSKTKCTKHSIRLDLLENAVLSAIQAQIIFMDTLVEIVDCIKKAPTIDSKSKRLEKSLKDKNKELSKVRSLSDGLYVDWKSGEITYDDYRRMKVHFEEQIIQLTETLENLENEHLRMKMENNNDNMMFVEFLKHRNIQKLNRAVLATLVETIYVHENKEITIVFQFADELATVLQFIELNNPESLIFLQNGCG